MVKINRIFEGVSLGDIAASMDKDDYKLGLGAIGVIGVLSIVGMALDLSIQDLVIYYTGFFAIVAIFVIIVFKEDKEAAEI